MDNATKDLIADMIESGQGAITGRARTWLNSQVAHALATALAEREGERDEIARLTEERDGARKALDYLMGDPAVPPLALDRTRLLMQHYKAGTQ